MIYNYSENKVTLIMPVYNAWPYIKTAVNSILNQTFNNFQLIIVNDGSTDRTNDYLKTLDNTRIKVIWKKHTGLIDSFNIALDSTTTKYVGRIDADDYYFPSKLEKQINFLEQHSNIIALGTYGYYMSEKGEIFKIKINVPQLHRDIIKDFFNFNRGMLQPTVVYRTIFLKKIYGYRKNVYPEDYDTYLRLGLMGELANLIEPLVAIRIHNSFSHKNILNLSNNLNNLLVDYSSKYNVKFKKKSFLYHYFLFLNRSALYNYLLHNNIKALFLLFGSLILNPKGFFTRLNKLILNSFQNKC